jgi:RNA polymerase sigma factor (sigma-70 family)
MNNSEKEKYIIKYESMIWGLVHNFKNTIYDHDEEELFQEVVTHLAYKLDEYDSSKSKINTYIYNVCKNKMINMMTSKRNMRDEPMDNLEVLLNETVTYAPSERVVLDVAYEIIQNHPEKTILTELIRGTPQRIIAEESKMSQQYVSKVWREFITEVKSEL